MLAIEVEGLVREFNGVRAVDEISFRVEQGEVFGFLGHNGAGKTTTVRLLNGVLDPDGGWVSIHGLSPVENGLAVRAQTGVLTETPSLEERLTARENLFIYAELYGLPQNEISQKVEAQLEWFELCDHADQKVGTFSRGMKQRLALARALLHDPRVLFLDEPTSGLDPVTSRRTHDLIRRLSHAGGHTVFLCTHNLLEAQMLCDRVAVLKEGRLVVQGTPDELRQRLGRHQRLELEVELDDQPQAVSLLGDIAGLLVKPGETGGIIVTGAEYGRIPQIVNSLVTAGIRLYRVAPRTPSLEDVYFSLYGHQEGVA